MDNNDFNNEVNMNNEQISPIPEVTVEQHEELNLNKMSNVSNDVVVPVDNQTSSKKSTILLILLFVFLFGYVFAMPYITEFVNNLNSSQTENETIKKDNDLNDTTIKESFSERVETKELVCISQQASINNYTLVTTEKFYYDNNNQILSSKIINNYSFTLEDDEYNLLKKKCEEDSLKYLLNEGFTTACNNDNLVIEINYEFDLETFETITDGDTIIKANASYKQKIDEIKNNLITNGYTCQ